MKNKILIGLLFVSIAMPALVSAQGYSYPIGPNDVGAPQGDVPASAAMTPSKIENINQLASRISNIFNLGIFLLTALGVVYIIYYTVQYFIKGSGGDESRKEAGMHILWGIVGLFVILSLWGLVNLLIGTFGTTNNVPKDRLPNADFINR